MSNVNLLKKIAEGTKLTEDELKFASDHAITVPGVENAPGTVTVHDDFTVNPPNPVVQTGAMPLQEEVVSEDDLQNMRKSELLAFAEENGIDVNKSDTNDELVSKILAALPEEGGE